MQVCAPRPVPAALSRAAVLSVVALLALGPRIGQSAEPSGGRTYVPSPPSATGPSLPGGGAPPAPVVPMPSTVHPGKMLRVAATAASPTGRERLALVMANGGYKENMPPLPQAHRDAWLMADALAASGFTVLVVEDATLQQMNVALADFVVLANGDPRPEAALIYYAGHGGNLSFERGREPALYPIDVNGSDEPHLAGTSMQLEIVQNKLLESRAEVLIAVIDACRNDPFPARGVRALAVASRSGSAGDEALAPGDRMQPPPKHNGLGVGVSLHFAFSQQPLRTAADGLYTPELAARIRNGCGELNSVFDDVAEKVRLKSNDVYAPERTVSAHGHRFVFRDDGTCPPTGDAWTEHRKQVARMTTEAEALKVENELLKAKNAELNAENDTLVHQIIEKEPQGAAAARSSIDSKTPPGTMPSVAAWSYAGATFIGGAGVALLANGVAKGQAVKNGLTSGKLTEEASKAPAAVANRSLVAGYAGIGLGLTLALGARFVWTANTADSGAHVGLGGAW